MKKNKSVDNAPPLNPQTAKLLQDRSLWVLMNLVGKRVELQVRTGEIYEGILHGVSTEKGLGCVIKMASKRDKEKKETSKPIPTFIVLPQDLVQIYAKEVSFENFRERDFATDTDISGGAFRGKERELQPWMPDNESTSESLELNDNKTGNSRWDQFKANKDLFGVETDYDENYYTTSLDKSSDFYKLKIKEASRIADEIEKRPTTNVHILEERGFRVESELDEEEKYSSVIRQQPTSSASSTTVSAASNTSGGKYVPPQRRGQGSGVGSKKEDSVVSGSGSTTSTKKEISEEIPIPATGTLGLQHSNNSLERTDSFEELGGGSSKGSPTIGSPGRSSDHSQLAQERLRLRLSLVNERLKNSAPVVTNQDNNISRSPLLSPLIGDPRGVNALSLEPSTPKIDENVVKEFFDFSLNSKKNNQDSKREKTIAEWKSFSKGLDKKGVKPTADTPPPTTTTTTTTTTPTAATTTTSEDKEKDNKTTTQTKPDKKQETASAPATTPTSSDSKDKDSTSVATKESTAAKSKLNPNAKVFRPGSSSSTTSSSASTTTTTGAQQQQQQAYMYGGGENGEEYINVPMYGYPAYGPRGAIYTPPYVPAQPMIPNQPVYPNGAPVRVAMAQPGYYPYPIYNQPGSPQMFPGARVMVPGNPPFYPQQPPRGNYPLGSEHPQFSNTGANKNEESTNNDNK